MRAGTVEPLCQVSTRRIDCKIMGQFILPVIAQTLQAPGGIGRAGARQFLYLADFCIIFERRSGIFFK